MMKGYLAVRLTLPVSSMMNGSSVDVDATTILNTEDTFFYVKEHFSNNNKNKKSSSSTSGSNDNNNNSSNNNKPTLFVANAPNVPGILTRILLRSIMGRFGAAVERVTVVANPKQQQHEDSTTLSNNNNNYLTIEKESPSFFLPDTCEGRFAHVVFPNKKDLQTTMKALKRITNQQESLMLDKLEIQTLQDETNDVLSSSSSSSAAATEEDHDNKKPSSDAANTLVEVVAQRYRNSLSKFSSPAGRERLLEQCNQVMEEYEQAEAEAQRRAREAASQPDDDGFITVVHSSSTTSTIAGSGGSSLEQSLIVGRNNKRSKRSRGAARNHRSSTTNDPKKLKRSSSKVSGAAELSDFYRFQQRGVRQKTLHNLRQKFEQDLAKIQKRKESGRGDHYRPF